MTSNLRGIVGRAVCVCLALVLWFGLSGVAQGQTAGVFKATAASGTLYTVLMNQAGQIYNAATPGFEAENDANWPTAGKYALVMTRSGTSQIYLGSMPAAIAAGRYSYITFSEGTPGTIALSDTIIAQGSFDWTGVSIASVGITLPANIAPGAAGGLALSGGGGGGGDPWATLLTSETTAGSFGAALKAFMLASPSGWLTSDSGSINAIVNGVFAHQVETTVTFGQLAEILGAYAGGNINTGNHTYSGINTPGTVRVTYVIDAFGNRTMSISP